VQKTTASSTVSQNAAGTPLPPLLEEVPPDEEDEVAGMAVVPDVEPGVDDVEASSSS
jgi:hypothetical protein